MRQPRGATVAVSVLLTASLAMGACGADDPDPAAPDVPATSPEASPEIGDITADYFGGPSYIGRTVTVTGTVTQLISDGAFMLDGKQYGDESLLVISAPAIDAQMDKQVTVTGVVREFGFDEWSGEYALGEEPGPYIDFSGEEVLVVGGTQGSVAPSAATSPSAG
jgi:hypothetical protein